MSKKKKKKKGKILFLGAALLAVGGVAAGQLWPGEDGLEQVQNYKTETVRRGTVSTGISEDGTAELGTTEQIFTVAEITEVSLSGSSDESSTSQSSSSGNNSGLSASGMGGGFPSVAGTGQTGSGMESMGGDCERFPKQFSDRDFRRGGYFSGGGGSICGCRSGG